MGRKLLVLLVALLAFSLQLGAVRAWPYPVTVVQPDGSTLAIRIVGDENWSCKTTLAGRPVYQDARGFWRETDSVALRPLARKQLLPEGGTLSAFFSTKASVNVRTLVIPVQFSDRTFSVPNPRSAIYNLFNQQNYSDNGATQRLGKVFLGLSAHTAVEKPLWAYSIAFHEPDMLDALGD